MLLVIEDKNDPCGAIAEETEDGIGLAYIPPITVSTDYNFEEAKLESEIYRFCQDQKISGSTPLTPQQTRNRMPLFLKAVGHIGKRPDYLTPSAEKIAGTLPPEKEVRLYSRG